MSKEIFKVKVKSKKLFLKTFHPVKKSSKFLFFFLLNASHSLSRSRLSLGRGFRHLRHAVNHTPHVICFNKVFCIFPERFFQNIFFYLKWLFFAYVHENWDIFQLLSHGELKSGVSKEKIWRRPQTACRTIPNDIPLPI